MSAVLPGPGFLERFDEIARTSPQAPALRGDHAQLRYDALRSAALRCTARLRAAGTRAGALVAIEARRDEAPIVAVLGAWYLGAAVLPFAPDTPPARLAALLAHADPSVLMASDPDAVRLSPGPTVRLPLDDDASLDMDAAPGDSTALPAEGTAYVLHTSGSTGVPKGVVMSHPALAGLMNWHLGSDGGPRRTTQFAPLSFDVAFQEIVSTLGGGGELVLVSNETRQDPAAFVELAAGTDVDRIFLPTAMLDPFCRTAADMPLAVLRDVVVAGEQLTVTAGIRSFFLAHPSVQLHNHYGPTETHVVTALTLPADVRAWSRRPSLGRPLPGISVRIEDAEGRLVLPGETGELVVTGERVADGYHRRPERTAERFRFADGTRSYRTGDLVRAAGDEILFVGRADGQVKIRGHRVEVDEVEAVLADNASFGRAAVCAVEIAGSLLLAAYIEDATNGAVTSPSTPVARRYEPAWVAQAAAALPEHMVPSVWVEVHRIPLSANGKTDRSALPDVPVARPVLRAAYRAPLGPTEIRVAQIWCQVLGVEGIGAEDPFLELGGTSLLAAETVLRLSAEFGRRFPVAEAYRHPTVRTFARYVDGRKTGSASPIRAVVADAAPATEEIAVVGLACRFPDAANPAEFWDNLLAGRVSVQRDPTTSPEHGARGGRVRAGGTLPGIDLFDPEYFGLRERDAALLDPQHRIFLECCAEALDDAGLSPAARRRTGVFAGCGPSSYLQNNVLPARPARPGRNLIDSVEELELLMASGQDFLPSRVSYLLDLTGPSINVNAACSTGLVAVHQARISLLRRECDVALAGAAAVSVPQIDGYDHEPGMMYSPDGSCLPFDARARGTVFSNGAGVLALKRLTDALADGDLVYAVLPASAIGNDGAAKSGMTAPSATGQAAVIRAAWAERGTTPGFVEGHGTATVVGDDIEVTALGDVFSDLPARACVLGSVKSNVGHLGWASGVAGLIKTVLAVHHGTIPGTAGFQDPCQALAKPGSPFRGTGRSLDWSAGERDAGVSAFGLGGVNAHVVVTSAPVPPPDAPADFGSTPTTVVVPLSARSPEALALTLERYGALLTEDADLAALASSAATGRRPAEHRAALVGATPAALRRSLRSAQRAQDRAGAGPVAAVFSGQGAEHPGMGRRLAEIAPDYAAALDDLRPAFMECTGHPLDQVLDDAPGMATIRLIQPLVYVTQIAMLRMWRAWGVDPAVVMGHSLGEFAAACAAGVFSAEDGLALVARRGALLESLPDGTGMAVVIGDETTTRELAARVEGVEVSAINAPAVTVVSGTVPALRDLVVHAALAGVKARLLKVDRAGHSSHMDPVLDAMAEAAARTPMRPPDRQLISNVTGRVAGPEITHPEYWRDHLRHPVRFAEGVSAAAALHVTAYLEVGGHDVLSSLVAANLAGFTGGIAATLRRGSADDDVVAEAVASLHRAGTDLDWNRVPWATGRRMRLPTAPFHRRRVWIDPPAPPEAPAPPAAPDGYVVTWRPAPPPGPTAPPGQTWAVLGDGTDGSEPAASVAAELSRRGEVVHAVADPGHIPDGVDEIVICAAPAETADDPVKAIEHPMRALLAVTRRRDGRDRARVTVLTHLAQPVAGPAPAGWPQASLIGVVRVARNEVGRTRFRALDLETPDAAPRVVDLLRAAGPDEAAHRQGRWYVPVLERAPLPAGPPPDPAGGTYLVVGGLRGLGAWSASELVRAGMRRLVLVGRTEPAGDDLTLMQELRRSGADVRTELLDVTDAVAVAGFARTLRAVSGPLGVLYCAGEMHDAVLAKVTWTDVKRSFESKAVGARLLLDAIRQEGVRLGRVVLYSSVTSVLGHSGQAAHAAANAALDAYAHFLRADGIAAVAVNWGPWRNVGFLRDRPEIARHLTRSGMRLIDTTAGAHALRAVLTMDRTQLLVLTMDWRTALRTDGREDDPFFAAVVGAPAHAAMPNARAGSATGPVDTAASIAALSGAERSAAVRKVVRSVLTDLLDAVRDEEDSLLAGGLDSLSAIRISNRLAAELDCTLPAFCALEHPSVGLLGDYLDTEVLDEPWRKAHRSSATPTEDRCAPLAARPDTVPPLTAQQRRWLQLATEAHYGHRVVPLVVDAPFDAAVLRAALLDVVAHHEALRYLYRPQGLSILDPEDCVPAETELLHSAGIADAVAQLRTLVPDPREALSWSVRCVPDGPQRFFLLLSVQHIDFDGTGLGVFAEDLWTAYSQRRVGRVPVLAPATAYSEYAEWLPSAAAGDATAHEFFRGVFAGVPGGTSLPGHGGFTVTRARSAQRYTPALDVTPDRLRTAAAALGVSPFALTLGAWADVVAARAGVPQVVVSSITGARPEQRFARTIGAFTAPVPIPLRPAGMTPDELARQAHTVATAVIGRALTLPVTDLPRVVDCFAGHAEDTYFSDVAINFSNYRPVPVTTGVRVVEILGPVRDAFLADVDFGRLTRVPGMHLVMSASKGRHEANVWSHTDRFTSGWAQGVADDFAARLEQHVHDLAGPATTQTPATHPHSA